MSSVRQEDSRTTALWAWHGGRGFTEPLWITSIGSVHDMAQSKHRQLHRNATPSISGRPWCPYFSTSSGRKEVRIRAHGFTSLGGTLNRFRINVM